MTLLLSLLSLLTLSQAWSFDAREQLRVMGKEALSKAENRSAVSGLKSYEGTIVTQYDEFVRSSAQSYLKLASGELEKIELLDQENLEGKKVNFHGVRVGHQLIGYGYEQAPATLAQPLMNNMLVLLIKFDDSLRTFVSPQAMELDIFQGAFQRFFQQISDGRIQHTGNVVGWIHLKRSGTLYSDMPCHVTNQEVEAILQERNIDIRQYGSLVKIMNCTSYGTVGGRAFEQTFFYPNGQKHEVKLISIAARPDALSLNQPAYLVPGWRAVIPILVHERGHNFGIHHSNGLDCKENPVLHGCDFIEYGNPFDRMGGGIVATLFNAHQQVKAGFKKESEMIKIRMPGTYIINKLTSTKVGRKIGAYIYNPHKPTELAFMLEYRRGEGMDAFLNIPSLKPIQEGVLLYSTLGGSTATTSPSASSDPRIIDPYPTEAAWGDDVTSESLYDQFYDYRSGIKIEVISNSSEQVMIKVSYDFSQNYCYKTEMSSMVSDPYVRLYYEPTIVSPTRGLARPTHPIPDGPGDGSSEPTLPSQSKLIKKKHIVLIPGDYFRLNIDSIMADHLVCPRKLLRAKLLNPEVLSAFALQNQTVSMTSTFSNYDKTFVYQVLQVPASALGSVIRLNVEISEVGSTTQPKTYKEIFLHIKSSHNQLPSLPIER